MLLKNQQVNEKNQKISKDKWKWRHGIPNSLRCSKNNTKWEVNSNTGVPQEQEKQKSNNRTLHLKKLEKEHPEKSPKLVKGRK